MFCYSRTGNDGAKFAQFHGLRRSKHGTVDDQASLSGGIMRVGFIVFALTISFGILGVSQPSAAAPAAGYTLTVLVDGVNNDDGNIGLLVFNSEKGWAEDRTVALKDIVVPAHPGTVTVAIPDLPAGNYAVAVVHDVNKNHKLDKNFMGKPKEQWGLSNNPHATLSTPGYSKCQFSLQGDKEIHITMQM
jgi:uncharacterized protein (DUF2141 family)